MRILATLLLVSSLTAAGLDGVFTGTWSGERSGSNGTIRLQFKPEPQVSFTMGGQEVKTKIASLKTEESKFEIAYDFELDSYRLRSTITGTVDGDKITGRYQTSSLDDNSTVDAGKIEAKVAASK